MSDSKNIVAYIVVIIITALIVAIMTEHLVTRRLELSPGVIIKNGRCRIDSEFLNSVLVNGVDTRVK